jgi:hypothetical protein
MTLDRRHVLFASLSAVGASAMLAAPAFAHHGWGSYDATKVLTLVGNIVLSGYENPHGEFTLRTPEKVWTITLAPPFRMQSRGLLKEMLTPGKAVIVVGYPSKNDPNEMRAERITVDGKTIEQR